MDLDERCTSLKIRKGSNKDRDDLASCLEKMGYDVLLFDNLYSEKFFKVLKFSKFT